MASIFKSPEQQITQVPTASSGSLSQQRNPWDPVAPFIKDLLPDLQSQFTNDPALFRQSLVPEDSAQTLASRDIFGQVGEASAGQAPIYQDLFNQQAAIARGDVTQDPLHLARTQAIANQARQFTEGDKLLAQRQAIDAGQFGLGSTALKEFEANQQVRREDLTQQQLAQSLGQADLRRDRSRQALSGLGRSQLDALTAPGTIQQGIGRDVESRAGARLADDARLATQDQEARRQQLIQLTGALGNLGQLGSSTQQTTGAEGFAGKATPSVSTGSQIAGLLGQAAQFLPKNLRI